MTLRQRLATHGGGGGGGSSELPQFAKDIASILFRGPAKRFEGQYPGGLGTGIFGDILQGYNSVPTDQLFGGLGGLIPQGQEAGQHFGDQARQLADQGVSAGSYLNSLANRGAQHSAGYNDLNANFLEQSGRGFNQLMGLTGDNGSGGNYGITRTPGIGPSGQAALAAAQNTGPDSALYRSTLDMLTPQVRSAYSARGMGSSGAAVGAENSQARQLADSFAQRANAEKNAFYQTAAGSEGANASLQGSANSALANIFGSRMQGATAATEAPSRIFSTMQGGLGQGIQNIGAATGQYLQPMQMNQAGLAGQNQGFQTPVALQQMIYQYLRSPQTQAMGLPSSTGQEQNAGPRTGLLGDILGFDKGS